MNVLEISYLFLCLVAPVITMGPEDVDILEGASAEFVCVATGRPRPTITWYQTVDDSNMRVCVNLSNVRVTVSEVEMGERGSISTLTLSNTLPSNAATYVCVAENVVTTDEDNATLTVNGNHNI